MEKAARECWDKNRLGDWFRRKQQIPKVCPCEKDFQMLVTELAEGIKVFKSK